MSPSSPLDAGVIRRLYLAAEVRAFRALRRAVAHTLRSPELQDRIGARMALGRETRTVARTVARQGRRQLLALVDAARKVGDADASRDLGHTGPEPQRPTPPEVHIEHAEVPAVVDDAYRRIVNRALAEEADRPNRRRVAQRALDEFADAGISVFTDRAGRQWSIDAYAEMATRTAITRARVDAYVARAEAAGERFLQVSSTTTCCGLCAPYDGKVIAIADLADARAAGLFHPNCRHGVTVVSKAAGPVTRLGPDPAMYAAQQRLRYLERRVRAARRREAVALDPAALAKARADVRAGHAAIRAHIARTGVRRQRSREQVNRPR